MDWIITGASRGIGRALALALGAAASPTDRLFLLARDGARLAELASNVRGPAQVLVRSVDLARRSEAMAAGQRLAVEVGPDSVLVHNAGVWPAQLELVDGFERAYATHCLCALALQAPLLDRARLARVLVVSAGLLVKGRFRAEHTPYGHDFGPIHTYCSSKLAGAAAMRELARRHPQVDIAVMHPGVVRTELGDRRGPFGALLRLVKRSWESPETCAERLVRVLKRPRWQRNPGEAPWLVEENEEPWPEAVLRDEREVLQALARTTSAHVPSA